MAAILMVDDDPDILKFGTRILTSQGHEVLTALNALDACELLKTHKFDMVISDANMPQHSGFDLLKVLRSDPRFANTPIALLTARRDRKDIETAIKLGVDDYIVKPIDPLLLLKKVETLFEKKPPAEKASFALQEIDVNYTAQAQLEAEVLTISEVGLVIETSQALTEGQAIHIDTMLFDHIRIKAPVMKVLSCEHHKTLKKWRSRLLFVGCDDNTLQKIRGWINLQITGRNRKVG